MNTHHQRRDSNAQPPPSVDESYWAALLREGENAGPLFEPLEPPRYSGAVLDYADPRALDASAQASLHQDWDYLEGVFERDETVELIVVGFNRGGLLVEWQRLRGFVPASQLVDFPATANPQIRRKALLNHMGTHLLLRVIEINREQNRLILSQRAAQAQPGERADILDRLLPGDRVEGSVTNLCDFGAFVDLGGLEGLIHISELSWGRVSHPADLLQRGQTVQVYVLEVNKAAGRIALSVKRLHPDPWQTVHHRYAIGQTVTGIITNVVDFGAFARIEDGLEGLIHVSELAEGHFLHPRNVVAEGQTIHARILSIDGQARRLGLSLRTRVDHDTETNAEAG